jgi:diguanylate cyclase (GGDEF)-like protein
MQAVPRRDVAPDSAKPSTHAARDAQPLQPSAVTRVMRNPMPALLLLLLPLSAIAAPERVAAILEDQRLHGYPSSAAAIERLQSADDVPGADAPLDLRRRYHGALAMLSVDAGDADTAEAARAALAAMPQDCGPCRIELLLSQAQGALRDRQPAQARVNLEQARQLLDSADPRLRLKFALVHADLANGLERLPDLILEAMAALEDAEQLGNTADQVRLMQLMVGANADLGHYQVAEELALEVIARAEAIGFVEMLALAHLNRGYLHALTGERDKQLQALSAAVAVSSDDSALAGVEVISRANLADYYLSQEDFEAALDHARRARRLAGELDDRQGEAVALANEGIAMARLGQLEPGVAALRESMRIAEAEGYRQLLVDINEQLVSILEDGGRYREALQAMHAVAAVREEITRQERERAVLEVQEKYASERKNREIERLSAENRLKEAEVAGRTWRQRLWAAIAIALALAAVVLVQWLARSRRLNRNLSVANASLAEETSHDALTGAANRRHFDQLMAQLTVARTSVGLIVLDLDHFKQINDSHGHEAGDAVLVEVTRRLQRLLREQDTVVRWGGEEFVLVLPGTGEEGLAMLVGRVLRTIGQEPVRSGSRAIRATVSAGCVAHPVGPGQQWEDAFRLADAAMYLAKQQGRNQAVCVSVVDTAVSAAMAGEDLLAAERTGTVALAKIAGPERLPVAEPA